MEHNIFKYWLKQIYTFERCFFFFFLLVMKYPEFHTHLLMYNFNIFQTVLLQQKLLITCEI